MGGIAPGKLKSRRGWPSTPRRLLHRSNFLDPGIQELTAGKTLSTLRGWRHSHRHRFAAAWPFLVRQNGPFFHRRRQATFASSDVLDDFIWTTATLDPTIVKATTVRTSISEYPRLRFRMANLRVRPG